MRRLERYTAVDISTRIEQDVLLLAGSRDYYVPLNMFYRQIEALSAVRSLTARLITQAEQAQNYCQVGYIGPSLPVIVGWLDLISTRRPR